MPAGLEPCSYVLPVCDTDSAPLPRADECSHAHALCHPNCGAHSVADQSADLRSHTIADSIPHDRAN